jgi:hypothetical protein
MNNGQTGDWGAAPMAGFLRLMQMREAVASVSLSHDPACTCDMCKAAKGDDLALARLLLRRL